VAYGALAVTGLIKTDISQTSEIDAKLISDKNRYFISRYVEGWRFIIAGQGATALGIALLLMK
jgi:hypothetical protein